MPSPASRKTLPRFAFAQPFEEMLAAQRDVAVVSADLGLRAGRDRIALGIDPQVHGRLAPAFANRLQFDQAVAQGQQGGRAWKQMALEVRAQAVAEDRNLQLVGDPAKLKHMIAGEELRLVDQDAVEPALQQLLHDRVEQVQLFAVAMRFGPDFQP